MRYLPRYRTKESGPSTLKPVATKEMHITVVAACMTVMYRIRIVGEDVGGWTGTRRGLGKKHQEGVGRGDDILRFLPIKFPNYFGLVCSLCVMLSKLVGYEDIY